MKSTWIETLAVRYQNNTAIRVLLPLVSLPASLLAPIPFRFVPIIQTYLTIRSQKLLAKRARIFFDELARGDKELTEELINNDDFLHAFVSTATAAFRTHRKEKIRLFANLLRNATFSKMVHNVDEYEEYLQILDEISWREINVLVLLDKYSQAMPGVSFNKAPRSWDPVFAEAKTRIGLDRGEFIAVLSRLDRTGCYQTSSVMSAKDFNAGHLTPIWVKLKRLLLQGE